MLMLLLQDPTWAVHENAFAMTGSTAAMIAAESGSLELLEIFVQQGSNLLARDFGGSTILHKSVQMGHIDVTQRLLDLCGDVLLNVADSSGTTPLHLAVRGKHVDIVRMLLHRGADCEMGC